MKRRKRIWLGGPKKNPLCCDGEPDSDTCHNVSLLQSDFHDQALIDATDEINKILERAARQSPPGTHLALLNTSLGLLLVWAESIDRPADISKFVTYWSPEEEIRRVLGIDGESAAAGAPTQGPTRTDKTG